MNKTSIEYLDYTWNPLAMRCDKISSGCMFCWHLRMADRLAKNPTIPGHYKDAYAGDKPPQLRLSELDAPLKRKKPAIIGVQFMGDLWHKDVEWNWQYKIFEIIFCNPDHTYIVLTKRPENVKKRLDDIWFHLGRNYGLIKGVTEGYPFPLKNLWLGVSVSTQEDADRLIPILLQIPAAVRWVSVEPMLEEIDLRPYLKPGQQFFDALSSVCASVLNEPAQKVKYDEINDGLDWVICGCESGPKRRETKVEWIEDLKDQVRTAGIPFFLKQAEMGGKVVSMPMLDGRVWDQYPEV